jgi:copper chaperone
MNISFQVPDMTCNHCVKSITNGIHAAAPDASVLCDLEAKKVTVAGVTDAKVIETAIREAGYHPTAL